MAPRGEVWDVRLEFWTSRTLFPNLPAGLCWDGSGCDLWAGTSGHSLGCCGEGLAWKGIPGALPVQEFTLERHPGALPLREFGADCAQNSGSPCSLCRGLCRAARLILTAALLLPPLSPLSLPSFVSSGNEAEHPLGKAWKLCLPRSASPAGDGAGEAGRGAMEHCERQEINAWEDNRELFAAVGKSPCESPFTPE